MEQLGHERRGVEAQGQPLDTFVSAVAGARLSGYVKSVLPDSVVLTISVPASLADAGAAERARILLVLDAVRSERMTWRAAAAALDIAPDRLLDLARVHGLAVIRYEASDLHDDLSTLAKLERGRAAGA
jgi:hypothetical protein